MSYEKVKRITIKDGQIRVCSAWNNIRPLTFSTYNFCGDKPLEIGLKNLAENILDGGLQFYNSKQNERWIKATSIASVHDKYQEYLKASEYVYNDISRRFEYIDEIKAKRLREELIETIAENIKLEFNL